jgi:ABC-2 type transport system ATP-binding protein
MIEVENIVYEYPNKRALRNISFKVKEGSVTALVGPNGAGKTTLMRCIAALDEPFSGKITVDSIDASEHPREIHKRIGYLSDFFGVYSDLTVQQCLSFVAGLHGLKDINKAVDEVVEKLHLSEYINTDAGALSRGWRQRLGIAQAIIHNPKALLLDEPASGLDPEARVDLSALFKDLQSHGMTLLVSSHILSELEDYCTDMLLLKNGELVSHSKSQDSDNNHVVISLLENAEPHIKQISSLEYIDNITHNSNIIECVVGGDENNLNLLLNLMVKNNIPIYSFALKKKRLQDIYMDYANGEVK